MLSFFLFFFFSLLQIHVYNNDFWWHLASGKHIVENESLPEHDPFNYTASDLPSARKVNLLRGYWLSQILFYKVYGYWDAKGIIILRSLLLLLFLSAIFLTVRKQQETPLWIALIIVYGVFVTSTQFAGERPVLFTFLIFACVYYLLEDFRVSGSRKVFIIPFLVMMLANLHPGYIVCLMIISIYLGAEGILIIAKKKPYGRSAQHLLIVFVVTIIASLLNANGPLMLTRLFEIHGEQIQGIVEFMPTFFLYTHKMTPINYAYISYLAVSLVAIRYIRKLDLAHLILLVVFAYMSAVAVRYMIFYMCIAAPILARVIHEVRQESFFRKVPRSWRVREGFLTGVVFIWGLSLLFSSLSTFAQYTFRPDIEYSIPEGAANFLSDVQIKGNMFNEYGFGGYLVWRLFPDKKVFIDGRALEPDVYKEYQHVVTLKSGEGNSWNDILRKYDVTHIVMPPLFPYGGIIPLVEQLFDSEDWVLVYQDHLAFVFVKNEERNRDLIEQFKISKDAGLNTIVVQATAKAIMMQSNPHFLLSVGKAFYRMERLDDAEKALHMAERRDPDNALIQFWIERIEKERDGSGRLPGKSNE